MSAQLLAGIVRHGGTEAFADRAVMTLRDDDWMHR